MDRIKHEVKLFEIIKKEHGIQQFDSICSLISETIKDIKVEMAEGEYNTITRLMNSENNAGWEREENHSRRMNIIRDRQNMLVKEYLREE